MFPVYCGTSLSTGKKRRHGRDKRFLIIVIREARLDGFWIDHVLRKEGIENHIVDPPSIATSRRRRRAKTDKIRGQSLIRALLAFDVRCG
jgi:transposase